VQRYDSILGSSIVINTVIVTAGTFEVSQNSQTCVHFNNNIIKYLQSYRLKAMQDMSVWQQNDQIFNDIIIKVHTGLRIL
jgi:hypothetical protein